MKGLLRQAIDRIGQARPLSAVPPPAVSPPAASHRAVSSPVVVPRFAAPAPDGPLAVIGDVHGMAALFARMLDRLAREAPQARVTCVGDLIDRGEHSAQTLLAAHALRHHVSVLLGNHEEMLLRFLDRPCREGPRWLRHGGLQTLASFGIGGLSQSAQGARLEAAALALRAALGPDVEAWMRGLPRFCRTGNIVVTHAGADPRAPIDAQSGQALTWGHPDFGRHSRSDGVWIAHGHRIVAEPMCQNGVISVDTGAFAGGGLSAAVIVPGEVHFLRVMP